MLQFFPSQASWKCVIYHFLLISLSKAKYECKCYFWNINLLDNDPFSGLSKRRKQTQTRLSGLPGIVFLNCHGKVVVKSTPCLCFIHVMRVDCKIHEISWAGGGLGARWPRVCEHTVCTGKVWLLSSRRKTSCKRIMFLLKLRAFLPGPPITGSYSCSLYFGQGSN